MRLRAIAVANLTASGLRRGYSFHRIASTVST
jgi:hypothetical protein